MSIDDLLGEAGISGKLRAENLDVGQFCALARLLAAGSDTGGDQAGG
jgi:hypothetical protein